MHDIWHNMKSRLACGIAFATVGCVSASKPELTFREQGPVPAEVIPWESPEPPAPFPNVTLHGPRETVDVPKKITFAAQSEPAKTVETAPDAITPIHLTLPEGPKATTNTPKPLPEDLPTVPFFQKPTKPERVSKLLPDAVKPVETIPVITPAPKSREIPAAPVVSRKAAPDKTMLASEPKAAPDQSELAVEAKGSPFASSLPKPLSIPIELPTPTSPEEKPLARDTKHDTLPPIGPIPVIPPVASEAVSPTIPKFLTPPAATAEPLLPQAPAPETTPIITAPQVPVPPAVGPVSTGNQTVSFETLSRMMGGADAVAPAGMLNGGCQSCGGGGGNCSKCDPIPPDSGLATRIVGNLYQALCCPDPCYQPKWIPLADTAFYTPSARPVSQTKLQWQYTSGAAYLDRGEYLWARSDGNGKGPKPVGALGIPSVGINQLMQYTETAAGPGFSAFFVTPYRSWDGTYSSPHSAAGFGDMTIGTKGVLSDSELFLLTMQFTTTLPLGNAAKGLGTGHVSLEPSLLFGLRVSPKSYLQGQIAEWIPIAGDQTYAGAMLHYHLSYNHVLWQPISQVQLIGTLEMNGYSWQDGGFTDPATGFRAASGSNILQIGPGFRTFYCDKYDFGVGSAFGVTGKNSIGQQVNFEMRIRY